MEPCAHQGTTPPCVDAVLAAGIARVVAGSPDPNPEAGGGLERLRDRASRRSSWTVSRRAGRTRPGAPGVARSAVRGLQGRGHARRPRAVPGSRWVSGEESRRLVHELRAASDAVAVGMGTVRLENPRLDARDVEAPRQPRRLAFGSGPLPEGSELELRSGGLEDELSPRAEGVQSLLLEGGPTLARRSSRPGSSTSCSSSSRRRSRRRPVRRPAWPARSARAPHEQAGRRGRPARGLPPGAVASGHVHRARAGGGDRASFEGGRLVVEAARPAELGDSVAIDGVCLTVVENGGGRLASTSCRRRSTA